MLYCITLLWNWGKSAMFHFSNIMFHPEVGRGALVQSAENIPAQLFLTLVSFLHVIIIHFFAYDHKTFISLTLFVATKQKCLMGSWEISCHVCGERTRWFYWDLEYTSSRVCFLMWREFILSRFSVDTTRCFWQEVGGSPAMFVITKPRFCGDKKHIFEWKSGQFFS